MAPNTESHCRRIADYIGMRLQIETEFIDDIPWQERERLLDAGEIQVCWICGLPYVGKADLSYSNIELLAAPVMQGERYQGRPVYFSDIVVRSDSRFGDFADLQGARWVYNERRSHSGFLVVRHHLWKLGQTRQYFGSVTESGSHQESLRMILEGEADLSALDSTVLETELRVQPEIASSIRIIETLGPSPMPPWVVSKRLPRELRVRVRKVLLEMNSDPAGRALLDEGSLDRFVEVETDFYDSIRRMYWLAEGVTL